MATITVGEAMERGMALYSTYPRSTSGRAGAERVYFVLALGTFNPAGEAKGEMQPGEDVGVMYENVRGFRTYALRRSEMRFKYAVIDPVLKQKALAEWSGKSPQASYSCHWNANFHLGKKPNRPRWFVNQEVQVVKPS
jgi:hypothetical protein